MEKLNNVKMALAAIVGAIFVWMIVLTVRTSMAVSLWSAWGPLAANPWAVATLYDAYFAFFAFWLWVAWRERTVWERALWLVAIFALGNIAMSFYVLIQIFRLRADEPVDALFRRRQTP